MKAQFTHFKKRAIELRKSGSTYTEIMQKLGNTVPKSTLSTWCKGIVLSRGQTKRIKGIVIKNITKGRELALVANKKKRKIHLQKIYSKVNHLEQLIGNKEVALISLAILYLGEGSKTKSSVTFGNSDPMIISLFLRLFRYCYKISEEKFRCTVQCRADQDTRKLENFWSNITKIPLNKFYKTRIDSRTVGKKSKKPEYKGVCRIDYFSADIFNELMIVAEVIGKAGI